MAILLANTGQNESYPDVSYNSIKNNNLAQAIVIQAQVFLDVEFQMAKQNGSIKLMVK